MRAILVAVVMLAAPALAAAARPTCTRAGRGATTALVTWELQVRYSRAFDTAFAMRCRADKWSADAIACFAALADAPHERAGRASKKCLGAMTVPQVRRLRDAYKAEVERIEHYRASATEARRRSRLLSADSRGTR